MQSAEWGNWSRPGEFYIYTAQEDIWDSDADTVSDYGDNCANLYNPGQEDLDGDDIGDSCDPDIDNDGLSNTEEDNIGSDPYNPDTDGDGLSDSEDPYPTNVDGDGDGADDSVDNCPVVSNPGQGNVDGDAFGDACDSNIDGDTLSNNTELNLGTDPYNPDTDGDQHLDGDDYLPLDFADGWTGKNQFQVDAEHMRLGDNILLVLEGDERTLRSFAEVDGDWAEVPPPVIAGNPVVGIYGGGPGGDRFVILVEDPVSNAKETFFLMEWSPASGWTQYGPRACRLFPVGDTSSKPW
ncbi:MAG: thrombospondin type 3 repeat-containing protein [Halioglobus sp.]|nr:thrombospondin type 3 repeat-containing protein [Halioglobus sp.]